MSRRRTLRNEKGQAVAEFALVLPALCLLLLAILQLGILFRDYLALSDATRAGSRAAAVSRTATDKQATVEGAVHGAAAGLDDDDLAVDVSSPWTKGSDVTVTATYPFEVSLLGLVVADGELSSSSRERVE